MEDVKFEFSWIYTIMNTVKHFEIWMMFKLFYDNIYTNRYVTSSKISFSVDFVIYDFILRLFKSKNAFYLCYAWGRDRKQTVHWHTFTFLNFSPNENNFIDIYEKNIKYLENFKRLKIYPDD